MAKQTTKQPEPQEYTVTLRNSSQRWTVSATSEKDAIEQTRKRFGVKRDARNFKAVPTRLLPVPGQPSVKPPPEDDPSRVNPNP